MTRARDARRPGISSSGSIMNVMRDAIVQVKAAPRQLGGDLPDSRFDHFAFGSHWPAIVAESRLPGPFAQIREADGEGMSLPAPATPLRR
jgi:hypothetical protein